MCTVCTHMVLLGLALMCSIKAYLIVLESCIVHIHTYYDLIKSIWFTSRCCINVLLISILMQGHNSSFSIPMLERTTHIAMRRGKYLSINRISCGAVLRSQGNVYPNDSDEFVGASGAMFSCVIPFCSYSHHRHLPPVSDPIKSAHNYYHSVQLSYRGFGVFTHELNTSSILILDVASQINTYVIYVTICSCDLEFENCRLWSTWCSPRYSWFVQILHTHTHLMNDWLWNMSMLTTWKQPLYDKSGKATSYIANKRSLYMCARKRTCRT